MVIAAYLEQYDIDAHISHIREVYRQRRDVALDAVRKYFPSDAKYIKPEGGLFLWIELGESVNTERLLEKCLEQEVAFVPGNSFYPNQNKYNTLRINFSNMQEEKITEGIARIGRLLNEI